MTGLFVEFRGLQVNGKIGEEFCSDMAKNEVKKIPIGRSPVRSKNRREQGCGRACQITCQVISCINLSLFEGFLNLGGLGGTRDLPS